MTLNITTAIQELHAGKVIAYPTEAVYGLGCEPMNEQAVLELLRIKERPIEKGLILIASDFSQLAPYLDVNDSILANVLPTWPGAVTWIIPAKAHVPVWLKGEHDSLAVRVTAHPVAKQLCQEYGGALVSTSANVSTLPAFRNAQELKATFPELYVVEGELGGFAQETAIYDALTGAKLR